MSVSKQISLVSYDLSDDEGATEKTQLNNKVRNKTVKITIPALLTLEEEEVPKKRIKCDKSSEQKNLLDCLPPPTKTVLEKTVVPNKFIQEAKNNVPIAINLDITNNNNCIAGKKLTGIVKENNKYKTKSIEENIIEVDINNIMKSSVPELSYLPEQNLTKNVNRSDEPTSEHRRRHQITYLAYQAKQNEQQLKNQWAMTRMTRKQTQAKYGF